MRVTNSMLVNNLMRNVNSNLTRMDKLNNQLSTGRKYGHISDDPIGLIYSQSARNKLARLENYQRSVMTAQDWLTQAELGIMDMQQAIVLAYETAVDAATDAKGVEDGSDKKSLAPFVAELRGNLMDTLNTTFGDRFVFGGYNTPGDPTRAIQDNAVRPFTVENGKLYYNGFDLSQFDGMQLQDFQDMFLTVPAPMDPPPGFDPANPVLTDPDHVAYLEYLNITEFQKLAGDILKFDVGPGIEMPVTMNGIELVLFMTPGVDAAGNPTTIIRNTWNVITDLYEACARGAPAEEISMIIKPLHDAQSHLLTKTSEIGGRVRRLELLEARYEQDAINYERMRSDAEDVDFAEVILQLKMAEAVYQASLSAGARIIQPTLMDFLR